MGQLLLSDLKSICQKKFHLVKGHQIKFKVINTLNFELSIVHPITWGSFIYLVLYKRRSYLTAWPHQINAIFMEGLGCIKRSWGFNNYETFGSAKRHTFYQSVVWTCIWGGDWRATSPFNLGSNVWVRNFLCKSDFCKRCFPSLLFLCSLIMSQKEQNQPKPTTPKKYLLKVSKFAHNLKRSSLKPWGSVTLKI